MDALGVSAAGRGNRSVEYEPPWSSNYMSLLKPIEYVLDAEDVVVSVGGSWDRFAESNGAPELVGNHVIGRTLWSAIADEITMMVYRQLLARTRNGHTVSVPLRCDSPTLNREMRLRLQPLRGGLVACTSQLLCEVSTVAQSTSRPMPRDVLSCSWCERVRITHTWHEVTDALRLLGYRYLRTVITNSHGMCPRCQAMMQRQPNNGMALHIM
jgi:hypothetical protein